jgi:hypothetical protein
LIFHDIKKALQMGNEETVHAVIALGRPDEKYPKMIRGINKKR